MKPAVRRTLFLAPLAVWVGVVVLGIVGSSNPRSSAEPEQRSVRALAPTMGYLTDAGGHVIRLKATAAPFCWVCGRERQDGVLLLQASHRKDTWLYRVPAIEPDLTGYSAERAAEALALSRVLAYDFATGERLVAPEGSTIEGKQQILEGRGFIADDAHRVTPAMMEQWPLVSMTRAGCVIVQTVALLLGVLWLAGWAAWWLIGRRRARAVNAI